jgi:hypothetical protein
MSRADFLRVSSLGLGGIFMGFNPLSLNAANDKGPSGPDRKELFESWHSPWQPQLPSRLSKITHELAWKGLSGETGSTMKSADWEFALDPKLSPQHRYAAVAMSVARNAPLRILPGELIVGSATLVEATAAAVPFLGTIGVNHTTFDFERILGLGYDGLRKEIRARLDGGTLDEIGRDLNEAALLTLDAADVWQERNIALLRQMRDEAPAEGKAFYQTIMDTLERVPDFPPRSFREAVQSLWSMYAFNRLMGNWAGIGRIDRMLLPYLKEDLKKGVLDLDEAREILAHFWIKGTEWIGHHNPTGDAQFYQNVIIGGIDKDGREVSLGDFKGKKVVLYAPTWRDNQHTSGEGYTYKTEVDFDKLREELGDEYVILFRAHYLVANSFDFDRYRGFVEDVSSYSDINELYIAADILVTDYSSVFFDYANLKKPVIFYMYDLEEYANDLRGFYISLDELPGPIVRDEDALIKEVRACDEWKPDQKYEQFCERYNPKDDGNASERVLARIIKKR